MRMHEHFLRALKNHVLVKLAELPMIEGERDAFLLELASWAHSQMSDVKNTSGSERTKHIRAFFRGMKRSNPIK